MIGIRHEKYTGVMGECPFSLNIDLERTKYNFSKEQNWHENLEIQLFTSGKGSVLLDGEKYNVEKDDIVVVNTNVLHYTFTDSSLLYTCFIISTEWCRFMNINYNMLHFSPFVKSLYLKELINRLVYTYLNCSDDIRIVLLNEILLKIIIELVEKHCTSKKTLPSENRDFETVKSAVIFLQNNFTEKISLDEISKAVLIDKYTLSKKFKKYTGQTIVGYLNHYRIVKAIEYLQKGYAVYETAELCGFNNLSFFIKTFKKYTGKTPAQVKRENACPL